MKKLSLKDLLKSMPQDFSVPEDENSKFFINDKEALEELRKARWLYRKLGEFLNYNIVAASSAEIRRKVYKEKVDYLHLEKNRYVCKQISEIYAKALNSIGINAVTVELSQGYEENHVGTMFEISSGQFFYTDLTLDLKNIKTGMKTMEFAYSFPANWKIQSNFGHDEDEWLERSIENYEIISDKEIDEFIDVKKVGYKKCGMYTNTFLGRLSEEFLDTQMVMDYVVRNNQIPENKEERDKLLLQYKFEFLLNHLQLENLTYISGRDFLKDAIDNVFLDEEIKKFYWFNISRENEENKIQKDFATCFMINNTVGNVYYVFKGKEIPRPLDKNEFKEEIIANNWILPRKGKVNTDLLDDELLEIYDRDE